jgi:hypothetical protein
MCPTRDNDVKISISSNQGFRSANQIAGNTPSAVFFMGDRFGNLAMIAHRRFSRRVKPISIDESGD